MYAVALPVVRSVATMLSTLLRWSEFDSPDSWHAPYVRGCYISGIIRSDHARYPYSLVEFILLQNIGGSVRLGLAALGMYAFAIPVVLSTVAMLTTLSRWSWLVPSVDNPIT